MANLEFILQGLTLRTHIDAVRELFNVPDIRRVMLSVAFVSESGVEQIEEMLRAHAANAIVFAGIRNDITSYQGLVRLHSIIGNNLYIVDTGARDILFHPKFYLVRGHARSRMIVGSANLTLGGLNNNIEASMMLAFDLTDAEDEAVVDAVEAQLATLPDNYPSNVMRVGSIAELDDLLASGRVVDETVAAAPRPLASTSGTGASDTIPRIALKVPPLRRRSVRAKATPPNNPTAKTGAPSKGSAPALIPAPATVGIGFEIMWESKPLTRRDLNIPDEDQTHKTGSINLDKGLLPEGVDHRHYFRDEVFSALTWKSRSKTVDEASAKFQLIVKGVNRGKFDSSISHTNSTTTAAYRQHNAMTRLRWGLMREHVTWHDLIGRKLTLYRDQADPMRFVLEID
jgi:hypothetical protein